jgi:hypothetical protein
MHAHLDRRHYAQCALAHVVCVCVLCVCVSALMHLNTHARAPPAGFTPVDLRLGFTPVRCLDFIAASYEFVHAACGVLRTAVNLLCAEVEARGEVRGAAR